MHRLELKCNTILLHVLTTTYIVIFKDKFFFQQATVVRPTSYLDALRCIIIRTGMGAHKEPDIFGTLFNDGYFLQQQHSKTEGGHGGSSGCRAATPKSREMGWIQR